MKMGKRAWLLLAAAPLVAGLAGCGDFWEAPGGSTSFTLSSNPTSITLAASSSGNSTITVTPSSSFTGTVGLTCSVTSPSGASSPTTCSLSSSSLTFSSSTAQTSTLTATSGTTLGNYTLTVTGTSGSVSETTSVCVVVGTGTCTTTASTSGNFYILNSSSVNGYNVQSGALTAISNSSFTLSGALAMAVDPAGSYLWVASSSGITPYKISSSGSLTQGSPISAFSDPVVGALQVDPSGKWLLDASLSGTLFAYPIASGTQDTSRSIQTNIQLASASAVEPGGMAVSPSGSAYPIIAVALGATGTQVFSFDSNNSSPIVAGSTIKPYGQDAFSVAIDPSNGFLYVGETDGFPGSTTGDSGDLRVFAIGSGSVTEISYPNTATTKTPYASGGTTPHAILAASNGYVYVANWQGASSGIVTAFLLSASTPSLTLQSNTVATGDEPFSMAVDSTGDYVMVVNSQGNPYFNAFTFDSTTAGQLDASATGSTAVGPTAIVAVPK
ncbi:MAG: beta-propeller fold lactonase family protein [Terracidiphilus sp.]